MLDILRARYTPDTLPYHVIVPSIPDYGFSTRPSDSDFEQEELTMDFAAEAMNELMLSLGFGETGYVAQGGDVGYALARAMANNHDACKASHLNMFMFTPEQFAACKDEPLTEREQKMMSGTNAWIKQGSAYAYEHGTRPSTIALTLSSNPVAMLAWMGEKFIEWSDNRPEGSSPLSLDTILDGVSLYWFSGCFGRTMWSYRSLVPEIGATAVVQESNDPSAQKPFGYSAFPVEIGTLPKTWGKKLFGERLVYYKEHEVGGHFAALQEPENFLDDVEEFLRFIAPKVGIVGGGKKGN